jgi:citrate synthase
MMNKLQSGIAALYAFDPDADSIDPFEIFLKSLRILSQIPTLIAYSYLATFKPDANLIDPPTSGSTADSFLRILNQGQDPHPLHVHIMDVCLVLHAEHGGGNNSTFATHVVSSSQSDLYSTLCAAIASLKGPLHGSANKKTMDMMADIKANVKNWADVSELTAYIERIVLGEVGDKSGKIYGLGHAVYTLSDPRATEIKALAAQLSTQTQRQDEYHLYLLMEEIAPKIFNRIKGSTKVITPNVDFFSGFVYDCLGLPEELYTPLFAMARTCGWCAHFIEEGLSGKRIIRPAYKYVS